MNEIIKKLTSRKFLSAAAGFLSGLGMIYGLDGNVVTQVAGAVVAVASVVTYIKTEGKIDAESVKDAAQQVQEAVESVVDSSDGSTTPQLK